MNGKNHYQGYTLIELMIAIAIIGIIAGIGVPAYKGYISSSLHGTAKTNAETLSGFEELYFYENDTYLAGTYVPGTNGLVALDWAPTGDEDKYKYVVTAGACGDITACYTVTVSSIDNPSISESVSRP